MRPESPASLVNVFPLRQAMENGLQEGLSRSDREVLLRAVLPLHGTFRDEKSWALKRSIPSPLSQSGTWRKSIMLPKIWTVR